MNRETRTSGGHPANTPGAVLPSALRWVFLAALTTGSFGIFGSMLFGETFRALSSILIIIIPVIVMIAYAAYGWSRDPVTAESLQFADSVYYLGFLFTLLALIASLAQFGTSSERQFSDFVARFGLALITTVLGLGIRVLLSNFRIDGDEGIRSAEDALAEASYKLRSNVDQISVDVRAQARAMKEVLEVMLQESKSVITETTAATRKAVTQSGDDLRSATTSASTSLADASEKMSQQLLTTSQESKTAHENSIREMRDAFDTILGETSAGIRQALASLQAASASAGESLTDASNTLSDQLKQSGKEIKAGHETAIGETQAAFTQLLQETTTGISRVTSESQAAMERAGNHLARVLESVEQSVASAANRMAEEVGSAALTVVAAQADATAALEDLRDALAAISQQSKSAAKSLDGIQVALEAIRELQPQLAGVGPTFEKFTNLLADQVSTLEKWGRTLEGMNDAVAQDLSTIRSAKESILQQVEESSDAVKEVQQQLVGAARYVTRELNDE